jgi:vacuolar protein sorting-associated protein 41
MRTVCLEPDFSRRSSRAFVCGGMADRLVLHEKGWLGHKETLLNSGEGPIWHVRWNGSLIAWANDLGVKIYDTTSQTRIGSIDRPKDSPRADLFKCTLLWQDEATLLIGWADHIQVARVKTRPRNVTGAAPPGLPPLLVEVTAVFQVDCMISGIVPHPTPPEPSPLTRDTTSPPSTIKSYSPPLTSFLVLAYIPPPTDFSQELTSDRSQQRRQAAERPELRIITRAGEELTADALSLTGFERWSCGDYVLRAVDEEGDQRSYVVMSPKDVIIARPRDAMDHVAWLVERHRYEEALEAVEKIGGTGVLVGGSGEVVDATEIGQRHIRHLVADGMYTSSWS